MQYAKSSQKTSFTFSSWRRRPTRQAWELDRLHWLQAGIALPRDDFLQRPGAGRIRKREKEVHYRGNAATRAGMRWPEKIADRIDAAR